MINGTTSPAYNDAYRARCLADHHGRASERLPNPHPAGTPEAEDFDRGWDEADTACEHDHRDRMMACGRGG